MKNLLVLLALVLSVSGAIAHSKVNKVTPENGSIVEDIPQFVELSFDKSIRLIRVEMIHGEMTKQLDLAGQKSFLNKFSIPFSGKEDGEYQINWRGLGEDGHAMKGNFSFEVK